MMIRMFVCLLFVYICCVCRTCLADNSTLSAPLLAEVESSGEQPATTTIEEGSGTGTGEHSTPDNSM
jgi:hypothetical protein